MPIFDKDNNQPRGPEQKLFPEGSPDRYVGLKRSIGEQVGIEWFSLGKGVDLTLEATGLPRRTLIQEEGDERPRWLIGRGRIVDIKASVAERKVVAADLREHLRSSGHNTFRATIGDSLFPGNAAVSRVLQEDSDARHMREVVGSIESPFEAVEGLFRSFPDATERHNQITNADPNLAWLIN